MRGDSSLYVENFPTDLHRKAKAAAALRGMHLRQFIIRAVAAEVDQTRAGELAEDLEAAGLGPEPEPASGAAR